MTGKQRKTPQPILDRLALEGTIGPVTRKPKPGHCGKCGHSVIIALEDCGYAVGPEIMVGALPVTLNAEVLAAIQQIPAFDYWPDMIVRREQTFRKTTADGIVLEHVCGTKWEVDPQATRRMYRQLLTRTDQHTDPPF